MWVGSQKTKLIASKRTQFMPSVRSVPEAQHLASVARRMSALGHVWTAPWQELSNVAAALVGCGHVSGLFVRLKAAELANIRLAQPRRAIATKDLAMVRVIKNSFKS